MSTPVSDLDTLKTRLRATWMAGDFGIVARFVEKTNEDLVNRLDITPGMEILDVACGTGNSAIPAAKRGARVTGIDIAPNLLEQARERAKEAGVDVRFEEGDAEDIKFPDASFDMLITIYGSMFAPRPDVVAAEMKRVVKPGGKIVMGNWTPQGFPGQMFKMNGKYMAPPPGMTPPVQWGDEAIVRQRLADGFKDLKLTKRMAIFESDKNEEEVVDVFLKYFGPNERTHASLDPAGREAYRNELISMWKQANTKKDGGVRVESEFLEVIATRA